MTYHQAIEALDTGKHLQRADWGDRFIKLQIPDEIHQTPYVHLTDVKSHVDEFGHEDHRVWEPTPEEMKAEDWRIL